MHTWNSHTRIPYRTCIGAVLLLLSLLPLITGCGGTSQTNEGFRIVPDGGPVEPMTGVIITTSPGDVSSGVQVTAAADSTLPTDPTYFFLSAYQLTYAPNNSIVAADPKLTISLPYATSITDPAKLASIRIAYSLTGTAGSWIVLPFVSKTTTEVTAVLQNQPGADFLSTGIYAVVYDTPPPSAGVPLSRKWRSSSVRPVLNPAR